MSRREYATEERMALLLHYLNKLGLDHEKDGESPYLVSNDGRLPLHGLARVRLYPEAATLRYVLPLPQPLDYRAELLEQINDLNERHHWEMTFYVVNGYHGWQLSIDALVPFRGCSRAAAKRAAENICLVLGLTKRSLYELREAMPDVFDDGALQKADEEYYREPSEDDFVVFDDEELPDDEEFDFSGDESIEDAYVPDWPEAWGDEEAIIARYEAEGADGFSGHELIQLELAYKRLLKREKQRLGEAVKEFHRNNPQQF